MGCLGKIYDYLLSKNANIRGKRLKKRGKRRNFSLHWGKNIIFEKEEGGAAKISYFG